MTSPDCLTGTDRLAEVLRKDPSLSHSEIIINIQGDEPCIPPEIINALAAALQNDPQAVMSTSVTPIHS